MSAGKAFHAENGEKSAEVAEKCSTVGAGSKLQIFLPDDGYGTQSVAVSRIAGHQFQALQQRAGFGDELDVAASRAGQDGVPGVTRGQAGTHQLIAFEPLFTAQATNGFLIRIGRDAARHLDGWSHRFLQSGTERLR